jgi:hypothetical protein
VVVEVVTVAVAVVLRGVGQFHSLLASLALEEYLQPKAVIPATDTLLLAVEL